MTAAFAFDDAGLEPTVAQVKAAHALRLRDAIGTAGSLPELADLTTQVIDLQIAGEIVAWPDGGFVSSMPLSALIGRRRSFLKHAAEPRSYGLGLGGRR